MSKKNLSTKTKEISQITIINLNHHNFIDKIFKIL